MESMRAELFLGFPLTETLKSEFSKVDARLFDMYPLKQIDHEGVSFLGKDVGPSSDITKIKLLEANIYSILAKILPDYPFKNESLSLFAIIAQDDS